jgi:hypothetical protein
VVLGQDLSTRNGALNRETRPINASYAGEAIGVTALDWKQTAVEGPTLGCGPQTLGGLF